ncbi:MAG TPA: DsbE family thiol:disulfide interchange protein [Xanthobacteraceae bacterium]|nr:DsbE family thiol:disulfide interchange protein [Xanthobacteraceae bacterium]
MTSVETETRNVGRRRIVVLLPLALFLGLALLFLIRLNAGDPSLIPSALIGHPAPRTNLPPVAGLDRDGKPVPGIDAADFKGAVTVVNVWASWCVPCHDEAPLLMKLAQDTRLRLIGINYKDEPDNARRFLGRYGNPFAAAGADQSGRAAIEWGVYGVPETFVVGRDAHIDFKLVGPITIDNLDAVLKPQIEKAMAARS